jgi:glycosyltransferase involved in cell wall biosynthesis
MIFCSAIIPTVGRSTLSRAVESVLQQDISGADFEVLVINDSGKPLPNASWQKSPKVQVIETNQRERSVARNTGAALSKGRYLHFLDDDDWLASGAYQHFWELSQSNKAKWLYGMTQLLDRQNNPTIQLKHGLQGNCFVQVLSGEWIPLQSSLIEKNIFMNIGGFNPLLAGPEDIDLLRRISLAENLAETPHIVSYVIRGEQGSTTDYLHHSQASRQARENILDAPNVFRRMHLSATDSFWSGRMLRVYLTSVIWNLQHRRFFTAVSRVFFSSHCVLVSGKNIFSKKFWKAVFKPYESITFQKGFQEIYNAS